MKKGFYIIMILGLFGVVFFLKNPSILNHSTPSTINTPNTLPTAKHDEEPNIMIEKEQSKKYEKSADPASSEEKLNEGAQKDKVESSIAQFFLSIFGIHSEDELESLSEEELLRASERMEEDGLTRFPGGYIEYRKKVKETQPSEDEKQHAQELEQEEIDSLLENPDLPENERKNLLKIKK